MRVLLSLASIATVSTGAFCITMNQSFLSSTNSDLPDGAFIATGLSSIAELADYLDTNPSVTVTRLFLSDSSVWDLENNYGFLEMAVYDYDIDVPDEEEDRRGYNNKLRRRRGRALRDHAGVMDRIMNRTSSSLESLSYLLYLSHDSEKDTQLERWLYDSQTGNLLPPELSDVSSQKPHLFARYDFPRLRELVLKDMKDWESNVLCHAGFFPDDPASIGWCSWVFPRSENLTHLHLIRERGETPSLVSLRESIPNLTYVRITGRVPNLWKWEPIKLTWVQSAWKKLGGMVPVNKKSFVPIPENLTLIIHSNYAPDLGISDPRMCATGSVEYDETLRELCAISGDNIYLSWPIEEDFRKYSRELGLFPVNRAIQAFKDHLLGGEGDWKISGRACEERGTKHARVPLELFP